ncbi:MAG: bis(5'-nucleosyl)-tetraphosphatase (symmetrical) YqeK [Anaerococcus sp.]|nr:bis(5'-nucleosyl)-tetraphosphatase (symmetrical) YqeK [Anaerococcus sp.]
MFDRSLYEKTLLDDIGEKRFNHSLRVVDKALSLSKGKDVDLEKVKIAGFLHDCAKYNEKKYLTLLRPEFIENSTIDMKSPILHAFLGAEVAEKVYNIKDREILDAIRYHTTGRENMSLLEKIIFLADGLEEGRSYPGVKKLREIAYDDLDCGLLSMLDHNIKFLLEKNAYIEDLTFKARNYLIKEKYGKS